MAATAVVAKFAVVNIVRSVTIRATSASFVHGRKRTAVATFAGNTFMCAIEFKARLHVMVKQPQVPGNRVVAGAALIIEYAVVRVVLKVAANAFRVRVCKYLTFMAGIAFEIVVLTQERKAHQIVIEIRRVQPFRFIVAIRTLLAEFATMRFVVAMTRYALISGRGFENWLDMAIDTSDRCMRPVKTKVCIARMIKDADIPVLAGMAALTFSPVVAQVVIIIKMTTDTIHLHNVVERVFAMTVGATQFGVPAIEWKVGIACVIKAGIVPGAGVMAGFTLLAAAALVRIVLGVTSETGHWHVLMRLVGVTRRTLRLCVLAF